jgi:hypothetical protein
MHSMNPWTARLDDEHLLVEVQHLAAHQRRLIARMVALLAELDTRRLYLGQGCSSLYTYCTQVLRLSEHAAYSRIEAARAGRQFPVVLTRLMAGEITLTGVGLLRPILTEENHVRLLDAARYKGKREIEELVAAERPRPDVPAAIRALAPGATPLALVGPLAPDRYYMQFTIGRATYQKLRRAQDLLRHSIPNGDLGLVFDRAVTLLLERLEKPKTSPVRLVGEPRTAAGRHIPRAVQRKVWRRDEGRCAFVGAAGRCGETGGLQFHHVVPYASGGLTTVENLQLRCHAHNQYEAGRAFGGWIVGDEEETQDDGKK